MIVGVLIQDVRTENRTMRSRFLFQLGSIAVVSDARLKRDHQQLICISFLVFGVFRQCSRHNREGSDQPQRIGYRELGEKLEHSFE
ncbi:hypothetical protein F2Q70_00015732 [Brassica cretica]|uniref:Uncharacterized protein n=1 Tax=Brassica cretica TaxID=69181 RepID=A0A8S9I0R8_BRACR|nr:hypothetical protein F2Q70_00015732 [Brassica cretica]